MAASSGKGPKGRPRTALPAFSALRAMPTALGPGDQTLGLSPRLGSFRRSELGYTPHAASDEMVDYLRKKCGLQGHGFTSHLTTSVFAPVLPSRARSVCRKRSLRAAVSRASVEIDEKELLVGTAISVYQNSGCGHAATNWSEFEKRPGTIQGGDTCGVASNFWELYEEDIALAKGLNSTCFRLSLEWSRLEPLQGQVDKSGVARYHDIFQCLKRHEMEPVVTLHHFVHPDWFDQLGGFNNVDNIKYFVNFATFAFREFKSEVRLWVTFNEPNVMAFCGWVWGTFPPARRFDHPGAGRHLGNQLRAHAAAYDAMKALPGGDEARVGLVHSAIRFEAAKPSGRSAGWVTPAVDWLMQTWATPATLAFFQTGHFRWPSPLGQLLEFRVDRKPGLDFIGINYYGRVSMNWRYQAIAAPGDVMSDMPGLCLYPEGLYKAIAEWSALGVPVYITETGVADSQGARQKLFLDTYIPQVVRAVNDGFDVRGLMYWTLVDNFEWNHGFRIKFGLHAWDPSSGAARTPRSAAKQLAAIFKDLPERVRAARRAARQQAP